jgi:hypothetical protein
MLRTITTGTAIAALALSVRQRWPPKYPASQGRQSAS